MYNEIQTSSQASMLGSTQQETSRQKLVRTKMALEGHLAKVNEALEALDKNPEFERVHNLLTQALIY